MKLYKYIKLNKLMAATTKTPIRTNINHKKIDEMQRIMYE
jgi:hypothetical protein